MRIGGHGGIRRNQEREPVRGRTRNRLRADGIIPARTVVDDDGVTPRLGQPLGDDAGHGVGDAARRDRHDELRPGRSDRLARTRRRSLPRAGRQARRTAQPCSLNPASSLTCRRVMFARSFAGRAEVRRARGLRQPQDMRRHAATLPRQRRRADHQLDLWAASPTCDGAGWHAPVASGQVFDRPADAAC